MIHLSDRNVISSPSFNNTKHQAEVISRLTFKHMVSEKLSLAGKTAVITGSSQGIGEAIALTFAEFGASIVLHYNSGKQKADQVRKKVSKLKAEVHIVQADFSKPNGVKLFYKKVLKKVTRVDILVINASVQIAKNWDKLTSDEFDEQIQANFKSTRRFKSRPKYCYAAGRQRYYR